MDGTDLSGFALFAFAMIGTPGPANMILLTAGARFGLRGSLRFVAGIVLGKQLIIWPIGFGLMALAETAPIAFTVLKWMCAAYIAWLAWRIAGARIVPGETEENPPGFAAGLVVHPLNPKAWAMITTGFTAFVGAGTPALTATAGIAAVLLCVQCLLHPVWCWGGSQIGRLVGGTLAERWVMRGLAALTVLSVAYVLLPGGGMP